MTGRITRKEALGLFEKADILTLGRMADEMRKRLHPKGMVTFVVDRNINYTDICANKCAFCAFWKDKKNGYVISEKELFLKIEETIKLGGTQILLQGGLNPALDINYYTGLLKSIRKRFGIHVHGFSPPEICHIADRHGLTIRETIGVLKDAGLDSIPGGGAEILSDRVRKILSPKKIKTQRWLRVMEEAHRLGMRTTATMMFGSLEKAGDIIEHLDAIRALQDRTLSCGNGGFTAFIPWSFQPGNTVYARKIMAATAIDYLKVLALARVYLDNIPNIQASWVTQGIKLAGVALRFGANDLGSTMIEENVVAAAGVSHRVSKAEMIASIKASGFIPAQRDTYYNVIKEF